MRPDELKIIADCIEVGSEGVEGDTDFIRRLVDFIRQADFRALDGSQSVNCTVTICGDDEHKILMMGLDALQGKPFKLPPGSQDRIEFIRSQAS